MTTKSIGLVAHDARKADLLAWVRANRGALAGNRLFATGNTGALLTEETDLEIARLKSGPLGGDQQLGAMIASGELDLLIFFIDPLTAVPHDVDVKALVRLSTLYDIPFACNAATADCIVGALLSIQRNHAQSSRSKDFFNKLSHNRPLGLKESPIS